MDDITARTLIEKFFNGVTTVAEEQALYEYFGSGCVAPDLEEYRGLFAAFSALDASRTTVSVKKKHFITRHRNAIIGMAAAAIIAFGVFIIRGISHERQFAKMYEGSYIIVNGERIDDLRDIKDDIEKALCTARTIESKADMNKQIKEAEQNVLYNIHDADAREHIYRLLNE